MSFVSTNARSEAAERIEFTLSQSSSSQATVKSFRRCRCLAFRACFRIASSLNNRTDCVRSGETLELSSVKVFPPCLDVMRGESLHCGSSVGAGEPRFFARNRRPVYEAARRNFTPPSMLEFCTFLSLIFGSYKTPRTCFAVNEVFAQISSTLNHSS
jgi:hypothetical protein